MHPGKILLASVVISVVVGLVLYYTTSTFLTVSAVSAADADTSLFTESNWLTAGGGALFMLLVSLLLALMGSSIGMSWKSNSSSTIWSMGTSAFIGFIYYFVFASAKDNRKDQFAFWSVFATIIAIAIPAYGWWQTRKLASLASPDKDHYTRRSTWATGLFGGSVVLALVVAAGLWKIHGALSKA
jgi:hypothetical protein